MPILPHEPDIYPGDLLDGEEVPSQSPNRWWALYTLPRREKDLMRRLRGLGISHYGPVIKKRNLSPSGRVRVSYVPLFAGYVFLYGSEVARHQAMTTNCISRCLNVDDAEQLRHDLCQIHRLIESDTPMTPESRLQAGAPVRIRSGAMAGLEGVVIKRRGVDRLLVVVKFLQQGASVQLEDFQVEPIG